MPDRALDDIFAVQDEVTARIVEALLGRLREPVRRNRPRNIEAYDLCVRARKLMDDSPQLDVAAKQKSHKIDYGTILYGTDGNGANNGSMA